MHPFVLGELIVAPNVLFLASAGLAAGLSGGGFLVVVLRERPGAAADAGS